jgi:nickel-dependent lactate racemase
MESLAYGQTAIDVTLPDGQTPQMLRAPHLAALEQPEARLLKAFDHPIQSPPLSQLLRPQERIVIVIPDKTRACGARIFLPVLTKYLNQTGIPDANICIVLANGSHGSHTSAEIEQIVGRQIADRICVTEHDSKDEAQLAYVGRTSRNTPVYVNKRIMAADKIIVAGTVVRHYFAGFGGGPKMIVPGCAGDATIRHNHALTVATESGAIDPRCRSGNIVGNPIQEDIREAMAEIAVTFLLDTIMNEDGRIAEVFAGELSAAHAAACDYVDSKFRCRIDQRYDLVIASCGGFPKDINFVQAHKTIYNAFQAVREGGVLIILAECAQGIGSDALLHWFRYQNASDMSEALRSAYRLNGTTALSIREKARLAHIVLLSALPPGVVKSMNITPAGTFAEAVAVAAKWLPQNYSTCILPNGSITTPWLN